MQESKIRLSPAEAELFCNAEMILTKNSILQKTVDLLSAVQERMVDELAPSIRNLSPSPKISRGENYRGLPYVILDYPRISKGDDLLFVRSMFWWGNFYSSTLQLAGRYKEIYLENLSEAYSVLNENNYHAGINADPWLHHFAESNYQKLSVLSRPAYNAILAETPHIKIAAQWPLNEWEQAENRLIKSWRLLTGLIS